MCAYVYGKLDSNLIEDPPEGFLGLAGKRGLREAKERRKWAVGARFDEILKRGCGRGGMRDGVTVT